MDKKLIIKRIIEILRKQDYGITMLENFKTYESFKVLIATILSVRAKDEQTLKVVDELFKKYDAPKKILEARTKDLEKIIKPIGIYQVKTNRIKQVSNQLIDWHKGIVPKTEKELLKLAGVGRKVANCILSYSFNQDVIAVDIHVHRITNRLGLVKTKIPKQTEEELMKIIPKNLWKHVNEVFVLHGQNMCHPRNPNCTDCSINKYCKKII